MKKFLVKWWPIFSVVWLPGVMLGTAPLFFNAYVDSLNIYGFVVQVGYAVVTTFLLIGPYMVYSRWSEDLKKEQPCPQCHDTGFERNFIRMELRHGANHHSFSPEMIAEHHLGYFLCNRCTAPSPIVILDSIDRTNKIKEFLDK